MEKVYLVFELIPRFILVFRRIWIKIYNLFLHFCFKKIKGYICFPHQLRGLQYVEIGENSVISTGGILTAWDEYEGIKYTPSIIIGKHCRIGEYCQITACHKIIIGDNLLTGRYVYISDNAHGNTQIKHLSIPPIVKEREGSKKIINIYSINPHLILKTNKTKTTIEYIVKKVYIYLIIFAGTPPTTE